MIVRLATTEDRDVVLRMGEKFYASTAYRDLAEYDYDACGFMVDLMLDSGILLLAECHFRGIVGMVGLLVAPFMFNHAKVSAQEVMWYVDERARESRAGFELLRAVEPACDQRGVDVIVMAHLQNSPEKVSSMYERLGFKHSESFYTKVI